jgi:superoxide dismutase, Fe-Mn family
MEQMNFDVLIGLSGFSDQLLKNHFTLYQGYVANTSKLMEKLAAADKTSPEFAELKRRFGWEFNGMRLHELYFTQLAKEGKALNGNSNLFKKMSEDFGSYDNWVKDFKATGSMRGIGWVVLYYDHHSKKLFNAWINEHDAGHLTGCIPILIMDVFEHAYMLDYGTKKADYIEAFFKVLNWPAIEKRYTGSSVYTGAS